MTLKNILPSPPKRRSKNLVYNQVAQVINALKIVVKFVLKFENVVTIMWL